LTCLRPSLRHRGCDASEARCQLSVAIVITMATVATRHEAGAHPAPGFGKQPVTLMSRSPNENFSPDEELFQRVPDGWLFTTPILWPVGGRKYVVNDAQKVDLVERLTRWRRRCDRVFSIVLLLIILWQLTRYDWITALSELVGVHSEILGVTIFVLIMLLFAFATPAVQLLAIRNILAGAVATPAKVGLLDSVLALPRSLAETSSVPVLLLCAASITNGEVLWYRALTSNDGHHSLLALLAVGLVVIIPILLMAAALFLKLRGK
jgi:hypothetical protein